MKYFKKLNKGGFGHLELFFFLIVIAAIVGVGLFVYSKHHKSSASSDTVVATSGSGTAASSILACQKVVPSIYGNIYQVNITYTKPITSSGFYGYTVVDGNTKTNRTSKTGLTYNANLSAQLTASASQVTHDYVSVFENVDGHVTNNVHVNPGSLAVCDKTIVASTKLSKPAPPTFTGNAAAAAKHLESTKLETPKPKPTTTRLSGTAGSNTGPLQYSSNWSGYVAQPNKPNGSFNTVIGYMVVPTVTCQSSQAYDEIVFWSGIDGWDYGSVEQDGFSAVCDPFNPNDAPDYEAWYENAPIPISVYFLPDGSIFQVKPGDVVEMEVQFYFGYKLTVTDLTSHTSASQIVVCGYDPSWGGCPRLSAEWITEIPSGAQNAPNNDLLQYTPVGSIFDQANDGLGNQTIGQFPNFPVAIQSINPPYNAMTNVTPLFAGGSGFYNSWVSAN